MTREAPTATLMVRLPPKAKDLIVRAAKLRGITTSDYVRSVIVAQAREQVEQAESHIVGMTPPEQLAFWQALHEPAKLTSRQKRLGRLMQSLE